jgi:hypothetical protein
MNISSKQELAEALIKFFKIRPPFYLGRINKINKLGVEFVTVPVYTRHKSEEYGGVEYTLEVPLEFFNSEWLEEEKQENEANNV